MYTLSNHLYKSVHYPHMACSIIFKIAIAKIDICQYIFQFRCAYDGVHFFVLCVDNSIKCKHFIEISGIYYLVNGS